MSLNKINYAQEAKAGACGLQHHSTGLNSLPALHIGNHMNRELFFLLMELENSLIKLHSIESQFYIPTLTVQ